MKKIERLWETKKLVTVNTSDLDELEQQRDELIDALYEYCIDYEFAPDEFDKAFYRKCKEIIIKTYGQTWEQIKAGKK